MIWQTDEACVEARMSAQGAAIGAALYHRSDDGTTITPEGMTRITESLERYARAVAVCVVKSLPCTAILPDERTCLAFAFWEQYRCDRCKMLAELGGADG